MFTLPPELAYGAAGLNGEVPPNSVVQFEVQLVSWITVVDICKGGGIIKKIMEKGDRNEVPGDLDEVLGNALRLIMLFSFCLLCYYHYEKCEKIF